MTEMVGHHFLCEECGYDLYTASLKSVCPECGAQIPTRNGIEKFKNPRRVNAQHRAKLKRCRRDIVWATLVTVIPLAIAISAIWVSMPRWLVIISIVAVPVGLISVAEVLCDTSEAKRKIVPED